MTATKKIPYITAVLILALSILLQILLEESVDSYYLSLGIAGAAALLLFGAAWKRGRNPEKPFYQVILFSLGGLFSAVIAQALILGFDDIDFAAVAELLLFLFPVVPACVIGYFTRKRELTNSVRIILNSIPGIIFIGIRIGLEIREHNSFQGLLAIAFIILVTALSAYAEAQPDAAKRRRAQWNSWRLFLVLEILIAIKSGSGYFNFDNYCYTIFSTLLHVMLPLFLWQYRKWLNGKKYDQNIRIVLYFIGAFLLTILQAGGLRYLMSEDYFYLSAAWTVIGIVLALIIYWQKPGKFTLSGAVGSVIFVLGNLWLLFAANVRLREIIYGLGGPAIHIDSSIRVDWWGYCLNAVRVYISGKFSSLDGLDFYTSNYGFMWIVDNDFIPYVLPITITIFVLVVVTAVLLVKNARNRELAGVFAVSIFLQSVISFAEGMVFCYGGIECPFTGYYIVDFVLLKWLLSSKSNVLADSAEASAALEQEEKHDEYFG